MTTDYTKPNYKVKDQKVISVTMRLPAPHSAVKGYPGESAAHFQQVLQATDEQHKINKAAEAELETLAGRKIEGGDYTCDAPTQVVNFWAKDTEVDAIVAALRTSQYVLGIEVRTPATLNQTVEAVMSIIAPRPKKARRTAKLSGEEELEREEIVGQRRYMLEIGVAKEHEPQAVELIGEDVETYVTYDGPDEDGGTYPVWCMLTQKEAQSAIRKVRQAHIPYTYYKLNVGRLDGNINVVDLKLVKLVETK